MKIAADPRLFPHSVKFAPRISKGIPRGYPLDRSMGRFAAVLLGLLSGCSYLGTAREWDPTHADPGFLLLSELTAVRQKDSVGCGPAALAMVLSHYGESVGPEDLSR